MEFFIFLVLTGFFYAIHLSTETLFKLGTSLGAVVFYSSNPFKDSMSLKKLLTLTAKVFLLELFKMIILVVFTYYSLLVLISNSEFFTIRNLLISLIFVALIIIVQGTLFIKEENLKVSEAIVGSTLVSMTDELEGMNGEMNISDLLSKMDTCECPKCVARRKKAEDDKKEEE